MTAKLHRSGGWRGIAEEPSRTGTTLDQVLEWIDKNLQSDLSLETIADRACISPRTLSRRFKDQTVAFMKSVLGPEA